MLRLTLPHPINDDSKTTRLVEGAGGVGSEKVHSGSGIQRVTDTQQRTTDTATPLPRPRCRASMAISAMYIVIAPSVRPRTNPTTSSRSTATNAGQECCQASNQPVVFWVGEFQPSARLRR